MRVHYSTNQRTHKVLPTTATGMCLLQTSEGIGRGRPYSIRVGSATRDSPTHLSTAYSCDQDTQSNWYQKKQTSQTFRCFDWLVRFDELSDRSNHSDRPFRGRRRGSATRVACRLSGGRGGRRGRGRRRTRLLRECGGRSRHRGGREH